MHDLQGEPDDGDEKALTAYVKSLGATDAEVAGASRVNGLGSLALDLSIRPPGEPSSLSEFSNSSGTHSELVRRLWLACGLPATTEFPFGVTDDVRRAILFLADFAALVGEDMIIGFSRVLGAATARMAEALADAVRVGIEVPQRVGGTPYSEVVRGYSTVARDTIPELMEAVSALFRRHLVLVSYQGWSTDDDRATITLDRTVGFADLVGSTELQRSLTVREMASMVDRFERQTWEVVTSGGGRLVKVIGDEAMFVHPDPASACAIATELISASELPIRIGMASGEVVAMHGDYYGPTVNLAARLVGIAAESEVLVSSAVVSDTAPSGTGELRFEPVEVGVLRGFSDPIRAYRLSFDTTR